MNLTVGVVLPYPTPLLFTDMSMSRWGTYLQKLTASGTQNEDKAILHISILKMRVAYACDKRKQ